MFETIAALTYADTANRLMTTFFCFVTSHSPCFTALYIQHVCFILKQSVTVT